MEDSALIKRSQEGDSDAFGQLYDRHIKRVYNFVFFKTRRKDLAEDITSDVFFKALKNMHRVDPEKPFMAWLYSIAANTIRDHYRVHANRPHLRIEDAWDLSDETDTASEADMNMRSEEVAKYLKDLSLRERDIIIMRVWQGLSYREIAEILGSSESALKMSYSRSIAKLRKVMPDTIAPVVLLHAMAVEQFHSLLN